MAGLAYFYFILSNVQGQPSESGAADQIQNNNSEVKESSTNDEIRVGCSVLFDPFCGWVSLSSGKLIPVKDIEYIGAFDEIEFQAPDYVKCYMTKNGRAYHLSQNEYAEICGMVRAANSSDSL